MQIEKRLEKLKKGKAKDSQSKLKVNFFSLKHHANNISYTHIQMHSMGL